jgi:hypothetical protein
MHIYDTSQEARERVAEVIDAYSTGVVIADGYAYTVGAKTTYVVTGLHDELMAQVLNRVLRHEQVFGEYHVKLVEADPSTVDVSLAGEHPLVQVLWPDVYGTFPDEDEYHGAEQTLYLS